jgi:RND family efflux transporter MFP subunit
MGEMGERDGSTASARPVPLQIRDFGMIHIRNQIARVLAVCFLFLVVFTAASCSRGRAPGGPVRASADSAQPIPIQVVPAAREEIRRMVEVVGSFTADDEVVISSEVDGRVTDVHVAMGDRVERGELMVEVSPAEFQLAAAQQKAALEQIRARLGLNNGETTLEDIREAATVKRAAADLADAEQKFRRASELLEQGLLPRQGYEDAEARLKSSQANYDLALQEVRNLLATLRQSIVTHELAEKKLRDTQIRAPFSGFVKGKDVSTGQYIRVQSPVVTLVNVDWVKAPMQIPEKLAAWIRVGQMVTVSVDAYPDRKFSGRISRINPTVTPETRSFTALARVENSEGLLKPGFFYRASIPSEQVESLLTIPQKALSYAYGVYSVFVLQGSQVQQREVKIGDRLEESVEIVSGLTEGDQVAIPINQGQLLFAGAAVEVAP